MGKMTLDTAAIDAEAFVLAATPEQHSAMLDQIVEHGMPTNTIVLRADHASGGMLWSAYAGDHDVHAETLADLLGALYTLITEGKLVL